MWLAGIYLGAAGLVHHATLSISKVLGTGLADLS
jgi:hypothetical protein